MQASKGRRASREETQMGRTGGMVMRLRSAGFAVATGFAVCFGPVAVQAADTIKIGYIDPLSGGGASVGEGGLRTFQYLADELNAKGGILGHKVEIVPMD